MIFLKIIINLINNFKIFRKLKYKINIIRQYIQLITARLTLIIDTILVFTNKESKFFQPLFGLRIGYSG